MEPRLEPLLGILTLNTDLVRNCCAGLSDEDAARRIDGRGNSVVFLAAHLTDARHYMLTRAGAQIPSPLPDALEEARSIDDVAELPSLREVLEAWRTVSDQLPNTLASLEPARLEEPVAGQFPIPGGTLLAMIAFLVQHESYHVGQMAYLRRYLGYSAMSYDRLAKTGGA